MNKLTAQKAKALYKQYLVESGYKPGTIRSKVGNTEIFLDYLTSIGKDMDLRDVNKQILKDFISSLETHISPRTGEPLARRTRRMIHITVKHLFRCLYQLELILDNPAQGIRYKPKGAEGKRGVLSEDEMNTFLDSIAINEPGGLQERCVFELMYSSALRSGEVGKLKIGDIDFAARLLWVREGKWGKDRVVPVSETAMLFLKQYLEERMDRKDELVFRCKAGRLSCNWMNKHFKHRLKELGLYRNGLSTHSIRHSAAVHLLAHGADIRYVQELLGHESLETTAGYTNELYENLKCIYKRFHPRENEYYVAVDDDYRQELERFYRRLKNWKESTDRGRETKRHWNRKQEKTKK